MLLHRSMKTSAKYFYNSVSIGQKSWNVASWILQHHLDERVFVKFRNRSPVGFLRSAEISGCIRVVTQYITIWISQHHLDERLFVKFKKRSPVGFLRSAELSGCIRAVAQCIASWILQHHLDEWVCKSNLKQIKWDLDDMNCLKDCLLPLWWVGHCLISFIWQFEVLLS
jgi:hypothetical protein